MRTFQLNFSQKIWLGFGVIILLLSLSSVISFYNLLDISKSTTAVSEEAVPVLKQSNQAEISLLKQAKLSSSGYNAVDELRIQQATQEFTLVAKVFDQQFQLLKQTVAFDPNMTEHLDKANQQYQAYSLAVDEMFTAKLEVIKAKAKADEELRILSNLVDDAGALLLDVVWNEYGDDDESRALMEGIQGRVDGNIIGLFNLVDEINRSFDLAYLEGAESAISDALSGIKVHNDHTEKVLPDIVGRETWKKYLKTISDFHEQTQGENSIWAQKILQIEKIQFAREKLDASEEAVAGVIAEFDQLLVKADSLFNLKQEGVQQTVDWGSKIAIIGWLILILLASQNFNSMRRSIKKKMADLAKLNSTGEVLASLLDKNKALEEVLAAMHEQVGVEQGSVYLTNEDNKLEVKAYYPPKQISETDKPTIFELGQGVLGKSAERKKIIFVPNTSKDNSFVQSKSAHPHALLCVPLVDKDVLIGVMNFSGDVKKVSFEDSDYEFASSIARLLVTTMKNIRMRETIEEQNRTLEQKVKERTAELRQKNEDIAVMMANLHQGLFTVTEGGVIHHEYSKHLEDLLETRHIANRNFMDLIFTRTNLGVDETNQLSTAIDSLIGSDSIMFEFNSHLLPHELSMTTQSGKAKTIEIDWVPIINSATDEIEKVMVTIKDVTELRSLQLAAAEQQKELEIIGQILTISGDKFKSFLSTSHQFIDECRSLIKETRVKDPQVIAHLFRNMHTIKGNARTYGFKYVADSVHLVEHTYDELRKQSDKIWEPETLLAELGKAEEDLEVYEQIALAKLGNLVSSEDPATTAEDNMKQTLLEQAACLDFAGVSEPVVDWVKVAFGSLSKTFAKPVSKVISSVVESVNSLAIDLDKQQPEINIDDGDVLVKKEFHGLLNDVFMHVFRNAMDHGIEKPAARLAKNKPEQGRIELHSSVEDDRLVFELSDDGKGMAIKHLYDKAVENDIFDPSAPRPSASDIAMLVFQSGVSTAEELTSISGRGVGMDAVKQFLEKSGGSIEIILTGGSEDDDFRPFKTRITLPIDARFPALKVA